MSTDSPSPQPQSHTEPQPQAAAVETPSFTTEATTPVTTETPPSKPSSSGSAIPSDERLLAAIGYIPMLFVAPLIMKPKSVFCQTHGKQGLLMTGVTFVVLMVLALIPAIGSLLFLGLIGLIAIALFQANAGVTWKIPFLYEFSSKLNLDQLFAGTTVHPVSTQPPTTPTPVKEAQAQTPEKEA